MNAPQGPTLPTADILNNFQYGKFVLTNLAAKRAKQLRDGAPPLVRCESNHPLSIALAEIAAGKIRPILGKTEIEMAAVEGDFTVSLTDDTVPAELGMLLPGLEEIEDPAVVLGLGVHDEEEEDHEGEADALSLTDVLGEDSVETVVPEPDADGEETLSLTDLADQENQDEASDEE